MITQAQAACLGLMAEIQTICDENGLRIYLIDKQLWASQTKGEMIGYEADFAMFYDDFIKFCSLANEKYPGQREFESFEENPLLPGAYYRYVNADSTFFNLDEYRLFRKHGVYVNIHIIRNNGISQSELAVYEWGMGKDLHKSRRAQIYGGITGVMKRVTGESTQNKRILKLFEKARVKKNGKTEIKLPMGKRMIFPEGFWDGQKKCILGGYEFTTVGDTKKYLMTQYGPDWSDKTIRGKRETYMCICCPKLPYKTYWEYADDDLIDEEFFAKRDKYMRSLKEDINDYNKQTRHAWSMFFSIDEQFHLKDKIANYKDDVVRTWNEGHHDNAMLLMGDYVSKIEEYRKQKVALVADDDLWKIYIEWLVENGRDGTANKLLEFLQKGQMENTEQQT